MQSADDEGRPDAELRVAVVDGRCGGAGWATGSADRPAGLIKLEHRDAEPLLVNFARVDRHPPWSNPSDIGLMGESRDKSFKHVINEYWFDYVEIR